MERHRTEVTEVTEGNQGPEFQCLCGLPQEIRLEQGNSLYHGPGFRPTVVANFR
jgi:hypothetical protein